MKRLFSIDKQFHVSVVTIRSTPNVMLTESVRAGRNTIIEIRITIAVAKLKLTQLNIFATIKVTNINKTIHMFTVNGVWLYTRNKRDKGMDTTAMSQRIG